MRLIFLLLPMVLSCNLEGLDTKKTGIPKVSSTIKQSKENGVFLHTLQADKTSVHIGGNQSDTIQEAWVEAGWRYESKDGKIAVQKQKFDQLAIRFRKPLPYTNNIWIKHGAEYLGCCLVASGLPTTEGKFYVVEKLDGGKENVLDSFMLRR